MIFLLTIWLPLAVCQFMETGVQPDMLFNEGNDRFDLTGVMDNRHEMQQIAAALNLERRARHQKESVEEPIERLDGRRAYEFLLPSKRSQYDRREDDDDFSKTLPFVYGQFDKAGKEMFDNGDAGFILD